MKKQEQYEKLISLINKRNFDVAHGYAVGIGFRDGLTAETFEKVIASLGLTERVVESIVKFYGGEIEQKEDTLQ